MACNGVSLKSAAYQSQCVWDSRMGFPVRPGHGQKTRDTDLFDNFLSKEVSDKPKPKPKPKPIKQLVVKILGGASGGACVFCIVVTRGGFAPM